MDNYSHLYDSHRYTNKPFLNGVSNNSIDYSVLPVELSTNPFVQSQPEPISYDSSFYRSHVPVYVKTVPSNPSAPDYTQTLTSNRSIQAPTSFRAQLISPEDANNDSNAIVRIQTIDIIAALIFIAFAAIIITLAVTVNPFIALGLVGLVLAIPPYLCCRSVYEPEEPRIIPLKQNDDYLSTNRPTIFEGDPTQTLSPIYLATNR